MTREIKAAVSPFLKWAGGKRRLLPQMLSHFPKELETYHEPFLGGGAVFFALRPERARLSDANNDLVQAYKAVQAEPERVIECLINHKSFHSKAYFYDERAIFNERSDTAVKQAARFIYLNKTCFNGLYRVNKKNEFNVPHGRYKNPNITNRDGILAASRALRQSLAVIKHQDFRLALSQAQAGDFVYCDPPYWPLDGNFTGYTAGGFGPDDQETLAAWMDALTRQGVKAAFSNSAAPEIYSLYQDYRIIELCRRNAINSNGGDRGRVKELLILNY